MGGESSGLDIAAVDAECGAASERGGGVKLGCTRGQTGTGNSRRRWSMKVSDRRDRPRKRIMAQALANVAFDGCDGVRVCAPRRTGCAIPIPTVVRLPLRCVALIDQLYRALYTASSFRTHSRSMLRSPFKGLAHIYASSHDSSLPCCSISVFLELTSGFSGSSTLHDA